MFRIETNGSVTFQAGKKPISIRTAQRDVRYIYTSISGVTPALARHDSIVQAEFLLTCIPKELYESILLTTKTYNNSLASASRAYCAMGPSLMKKKMYSMNLYMPLQDLDQCRDLPAELVSALRASGQPEVLFNAREY